MSTGGRPDANSGGLRVRIKLPGSRLAEDPQHFDADLRLHRDGDANGTAVKFLLDSGADLVTIPRSLAARLVSEADFISYATFVTADGSKHKAPIVRLRSLTVGGITLANVECVISGGSDALLGQSFLKKLDAFSIDYQRNVLKLGAQP